MPAALTDHLENKLLDHLLGGGDYTAPPTHHFALFTAAPSDTTTGTEVSGGSYARVSVANNPTLWPAAAAYAKSNASAIAFPTATAGWGSVTHWGIFDNVGSLLAWGALDSPVTVNTGDTAAWSEGALTVSFLSGGFGASVREGLLDLAFGGTSYSRPSTVYAAAFTSPPGVSGGGIEVAGTGYERVAIPNNSANFPGAVTGAKSNAQQISFPTAASAWGSVSDFALFDSVTGGNILLFCALNTARTINTTSTLRVNIGDLDVALD